MGTWPSAMQVWKWSTCRSRETTVAHTNGHGEPVLSRSLTVCEKDWASCSVTTYEYESIHYEMELRRCSFCAPCPGQCALSTNTLDERRMKGSSPPSTHLSHTYHTVHLGMFTLCKCLLFAK